ncbi:MAG: outer membrane protein assembly factor BamB family protein [Planctomycetota bacterium]
MIDLGKGSLLQHNWIRGNCKHGILPCNGMLYIPPHQCACYIESKLNGLWALAPARPSPPPAEPQDAGRLTRGPAYGQVVAPAARAARAPTDEWPVFRHDNARSGCAATDVPEKIGRLWSASVGGRLSQPVMSDGKVFVASLDDDSVHALDAATGDRIWRFTAGGKVDSPPTLSGGYAVFGAADGYVYALRVADGVLAWRCRAAPRDLRMIAENRVESVWPVHGSVLVEEGAVCAAAGRSSYLDGGIELASGEVLVGKSHFSRDPETGATVAAYRVNTGDNVGADRELAGMLPDILSSDREHIYMRHAVLSREFEVRDGYETHLFGSLGFLDDTWWERSFWLYGKHFYSGCTLWPYADRLAPGGRMLVFDDRKLYGYHEAKGKMNASTKKVRLSGSVAFAVDRRPKLMTDDEVVRASRKKIESKKDRKKALRVGKRYSYDWERDIPVMPRAMVLTPEHFITAGPPRMDFEKTAAYFATNATDSDELPPHVREALDAFEGRSEGLLVILRKDDGSVAKRHALDCAPAFDGMIAAGGRLFVSLLNGKLECWGRK